MSGVGGVAGPARTSTSLVWSSDLSVAQSRAKAEGKTVLIHFTGSDWCGWCIKLRKEVFLKQEFEQYARSNLVLVVIDFPKRKALPAAVQAANQRVAEQFQVQGFPTLILLASNGHRLGNVNYGHGGPKAFLAEVEKLINPPRELPPPKPRPSTPLGPRRAASHTKTGSSALIPGPVPQPPGV